MLLRELRIKARELKIKGRSKMNKAQLIDAIKAKQWTNDREEQDNAFLTAQEQDLRKETRKETRKEIRKELEDEEIDLKNKMSILRKTTLKGKERIAIGDEIVKIRDKLREIHLEIDNLIID